MVIVCLSSVGIKSIMPNEIFRGFSPIHLLRASVPTSRHAKRALRLYKHVYTKQLRWLTMPMLTQASLVKLELARRSALFT
jgi:hypothetical protein